MRRLALTICLATALFSGAVGVLAQETTPPATPTPAPTLRSPFLVVDQEALFANSAYGQRVTADIDTESRLLAEENRRLEAELSAEERDLTERRPTLDPEEFRQLADDFDARVTQIRTEQDAKARALTERGDMERRRFLSAAVPILGQIMRDVGAGAIFDQRSVFLSDDRLDITDRAIDAINATIGDGTGQLLTAPEPLDPATPDPAAPSDN
jgi:Skp family chaperone for outer membrane proteins